MSYRDRLKKKKKNTNTRIAPMYDRFTYLTSTIGRKNIMSKRKY